MASLSTRTIVLLSRTTVLESPAECCDTRASSEGNASPTLGTSSVDVLSIGSSSERESAGKSFRDSSAFFAGSFFVTSTKLFCSFFVLRGDNICSNVVGAASVSEPEVRSVPVSVPDDPFG